jgi:hypothetical protein
VIAPLIDIILLPLVYPAAYLMKMIRRFGVHRMPVCKKIFMQVGVFPIRNHYYEPLFDTNKLKKALGKKRTLPGIDWNTEEQLCLLEQFAFNEELKNIPFKKQDGLEFHFNNIAFESGDAEFFYNMIRLKKPSRIYEIGCGYSTLMALKAIGKNRNEQTGYKCEHLCIEPYENPWLEDTGVKILRQKVEDIDKKLFSSLDKDDILFIDSSHNIRPGGDVVFEILELLPVLNTGVIVHIHDIFSPGNYLEKWLVDEIRFWNEQYLVEAFLSCNKDWQILAALNYLHHNYFDQLQLKCPYLTRDREPGSLYIQKIA